MGLTEFDGVKIREKVARIESISEETSSNGNEYVLVEDTGGSKFYVWNDGWKDILVEEESFYRSRTVRINYVAEDPPYYCVLRYLYPVEWDDSKPEENDFEVSMDMTEQEQDDVLNANDVPREERIVNQASMKFAAKMLDHKLDGDEVYSDEVVEEELNKWMNKFKRAAVTGEVQ